MSTTIADRIITWPYISHIWSYIASWGWTLVATIIIGIAIYRLLRPTQHQHQRQPVTMTPRVHAVPSAARVTAMTQSSSRRSNNNESSSSSSSGTLSSRYSISLQSHYDHHPSFVTASLAAAIDEAKLQNQ